MEYAAGYKIWYDSFFVLEWLTEDEKVTDEGQIEKPQPELVPKEPIKVVGDFEFVDIDMNDENEVRETR